MSERDEKACLIDVTFQPRATAYLQIRDPRKPFPPHTTSFFAADMVQEASLGLRCLVELGIDRWSTTHERR